MAKIPIIKLNNGESSYYPLSVGESTVTTHEIEVKNNVGGYSKGEIVPAVTTFDNLVTKLLNNENPNSNNNINIDGVTIIQDENGQIKVNIDNVLSTINFEGVTATSGKIINSISQSGGIISANTRDLTEDDIPTLPINKIDGLEAALANAGGSDQTVIMNEVSRLDTQLHDIITAETKNSIDKLKFNFSDTFEIHNQDDILNTLKQILIKLGVSEDAITIHSSAFSE